MNPYTRPGPEPAWNDYKHDNDDSDDSFYENWDADDNFDVSCDVSTVA